MAIRFRDTTFRITLKQSGAGVDLADYPGIAIFLYQEGNEYFKRYSRVSTAEWDDITIEDESAGIVTIYLPRSAWSSVIAGKDLLAEVKVRKSLTGAEDDQYDPPIDPVVLIAGDQIFESVSASITPP